ncbi:MAG: serine/threonine-protein kinase [Acidimicrobiales bacterium]
MADALQGPAMLEVPGYEDLSEIGRGGFAVVYRARQVSLNRPVALKVLYRGGVDPRVFDRFLRECEVMGSLSWHPRIVGVYDAGRLDTGGFLALEHLDGGTLDDRLTRAGRIPWPEVVSIGIQVADALHAAHLAGVLHRDVKPQNVLTDRFGGVKLGDFGIAAVAGQETTADRVAVGTPAYMAPEVLSGARADRRADLYSLGSLLYTLLAGSPAFVRPTDESIVQVFVRATQEPVPDLRGLGLPDELAGVVEALMSKNPEERPASAADAIGALAGIERRFSLDPTPTYWNGGNGSATGSVTFEVLAPPAHPAAPTPTGARVAAALRRRPRPLLVTAVVAAAVIGLGLFGRYRTADVASPSAAGAEAASEIAGNPSPSNPAAKEPQPATPSEFRLISLPLADPCTNPDGTAFDSGSCHVIEATWIGDADPAVHYNLTPEPFAVGGPTTLPIGPAPYPETEGRRRATFAMRPGSSVCVALRAVRSAPAGQVTASSETATTCLTTPAPTEPPPPAVTSPAVTSPPTPTAPPATAPPATTAPTRPPAPEPEPAPPSTTPPPTAPAPEPLRVPTELALRVLRAVDPCVNAEGTAFGSGPCFLIEVLWTGQDDPTVRYSIVPQPFAVGGPTTLPIGPAAFPHKGDRYRATFAMRPAASACVAVRALRADAAGRTTEITEPATACVTTPTNAAGG